MSERRDPLELLDESHEAFFGGLYRDLSDAFPHPFDWMGLMKRPHWWQYRRREAYGKVRLIFAKYGFILSDHCADKFQQTPPQQLGEDAGGAIVRKLRQTFQWQMGVPYEPETP